MHGQFEKRETIKLLEDMQRRVNQLERKVEQREGKIDARLATIEERLANVSSSNTGGGKPKISQATEETLAALSRLGGPHCWVSIGQPASETKRPIPTEAAYAKRLYEIGMVSRQAFLVSRAGRKIREYRYRPRNSSD